MQAPTLSSAPLLLQPHSVHETDDKQGRANGCRNVPRAVAASARTHWRGGAGPTAVLLHVMAHNAMQQLEIPKKDGNAGSGGSPSGLAPSHIQAGPGLTAGGGGP